MSLVDRMTAELDEQLKVAGDKLLKPPSSLDELLPLLDEVERSLSKVEQSPVKSTHNALSSLMKALVANELLRHPDIDVKVAVASCISEITRITAPDTPYDDDMMKDIFRLIASTFEHLSDRASRSYRKRVSILETLARVRSCVVMLDLECDELILEMFQHFLKTIRDYHPEKVFSSMVTIMSLVVDESEDISIELLTTLLSSMKKDNQEVLPTARRLVETVFKKCAVKLKPYLTQAIKSLNISLDDYSNILTSVSEGTAGLNHDNASREQLETKTDREACPEDGDPSANRSPKSIMTNDISETKKEETSAEVECLEKAVHLDTDKATIDEVTPKPRSNDFGAEKSIISEFKPEQSSEGTGRKLNSSMISTESSDPLCFDGEKEADKLPENRESDGKDADGSPSDDMCIQEAKHLEKGKDISDSEAHEGANVASLSPSEGLANDTPPRDGECPKKKESLIQDEIPSPEVVTNKAFERTSDSEAKPQRLTVEKASPEIANKDKTSSEVESSINEDGRTSDAEAKPQKQLDREIDASANDEDDSSMKKKEDLKEHGPVEARHLEKEKDINDSGACEGANVASPSPSEGNANETPTNRGVGPEMKESLIQEEIPCPKIVTKNASERTSDLEAKPRRITVKIASRETFNKDKTSSKVGTSQNEDRTSSDAEAKPGKQPRKKMDTSVTDDEDSLMEEKGAKERDPEEAKHMEKEKDIGNSEAHEGANFASPSPSDGIAYENPSSKGEHTKKKEGLIQEEIPCPEVVAKKTSERTSKLEPNPKRRTWNKASRETNSKDKTLSEISTSKNEDGTANDAEAKPQKQPAKKMDARVSDEYGSSMKKKEDAKECGPEEAMHLEKEKDIGDSEAHEGANVASPSPSEDTANESPPKKGESPKKKESLIQEAVPCPEVVIKKASERTSDSEAKPQRRTVKFFFSPETTNKDKTSSEVGTSKNEDVTTTDPEATPRKQPGRTVDASVDDEDDCMMKKKEDEEECVPEEAKHLEKGKTIIDSEAHESPNVASPSSNEGIAYESPPTKGDLLKKKASLIQEEIPRPEVDSQKASERPSESKAKPQRRTKKKPSRETTTNKDKTSSKVGTSKIEEGATSDSEAKPGKQAGVKKVASVNYEENSSMKKKEGAKELGRGKASAEKQSMKSSTKDEIKEAVSSPKPRTKSVKEEDREDKICTKRKRTPSKEKASETMKYGQNLVGSKVKVWWPEDKMFYEGVIDSFDSAKKKHKVSYNDGDEEVLNLRKERWAFIADDSSPDVEAEDEPASTDASSEMPKKKNAKRSADSSVKHELEEVVPKRGSSASSSKLKGTSSKSGKKPKDVGKVVQKSSDGTSESDDISDDEIDKKFKSLSQKTSGKSLKDSLKSSGKSKDSGTTPKSKSKQDTSKTASKSKEETPKTVSKNKEETPKTVSKNKEDTPKTAAKSKDKTPASGTKSSGNSAHKGKSSSSKGKGGEHVKEKLNESTKKSEGTKRKQSDLSEERENETKGGKKRQKSVKG